MAKFTTTQIENATKQPQGTKYLKGELDGHKWLIRQVDQWGGKIGCSRHAYVTLDGVTIATRCNWREACRLVARKLNEKV